MAILWSLHSVLIYISYNVQPILELILTILITEILQLLYAHGSFRKYKEFETELIIYILAICLF